MKVFYLSILLFSFFSFIVAQNDLSESKNVFSGEFSYSTGYTGAKYKFTTDGKFEQTTFSDCCDPVWYEMGKFTLNENKISLKVLRKTLNNYSSEDKTTKTYDLLNQNQAIQAFKDVYNYSDSEAKNRLKEIKTEYEMQIVKWGDRTYVMETSLIRKFAMAVNLGIEPRHRASENFLTSEVYLGRGDAEKQIKGKPDLPEYMSSYLQDSPIEVKIIKKEKDKQGKKVVYTINKGMLDGLKRGMFFVGKDKEPVYENLLWVISVDENTANLENSFADYQEESILVNKKN